MPTHPSLKQSCKAIKSILFDLKLQNADNARISDAQQKAKIILKTLNTFDKRIKKALTYAPPRSQELPLLTLITQHINQSFVNLERLLHEKDEFEIESIAHSLRHVFKSHYLDEAIQSAEKETQHTIQLSDSPKHTRYFSSVIAGLGILLFVIGATLLAKGIGATPAAACLAVGALMFMFGVALFKENIKNHKAITTMTKVMLERKYLKMADQLAALVDALVEIRKQTLNK